MSVDEGKMIKEFIIIWFNRHLHIKHLIVPSNVVINVRVDEEIPYIFILVFSYDNKKLIFRRFCRGKIAMKNVSSFCRIHYINSF